MRLGYVGLDNSHAEFLINEINVNRPAGLPAGRFTHIWGKDPARAKQLQEKGGVDKICETPEQLLGQVDAVIVGARHGDRHLPEARPFLEAGMTVYIDKPLAISLADARAILDLAARHGARVTSFSSARLDPETVKFKADYRGITAERYGGGISGHGDSGNPYGGWYFYAVHSLELLLECFAPMAGEVLAAVIGKQMHVRVACDDGQIVSILMSPAWPPFSLIGYADHQTVAAVLPLGRMALENTQRILNFLHGAEDLSPRELLAPLIIMDAINTSLKTGGPARFEV